MTNHDVIRLCRTELDLKLDEIEKGDGDMSQHQDEAREMLKSLCEAVQTKQEDEN